jgi:iron complex outermembrane receptor protein/vitamin B12 transporter
VKASGSHLLRLAVLLACAAPGLSQEPPRPPVADTFYATATVRERPLDSATAAVTVIDRETIEASGARTVAELLRLTPGVDLTTNGTRGGFTTAQIRGGDPNFTLVLLDGVPLNDPTYQVGDAFDLEGLSTSAVERIEIVRGPLSSVYGSTGLAGAIHIFTREGAPGAVVPEAAAFGGSGSRRGADASLSGGLGHSSGETGGEGRGTWFLGLSSEEERHLVAAERFRQLSAQGSLTLPLGGDARLLLRARQSDWEGDDYPDASGGPLYGSGELRHSEHTESSLGGELQLGRDGRHRLAFAAYRHDLDSASPEVPPQVPRSRQQSVFTTTRLGWSSVLAATNGVQWTGGVDVTREKGDNDSVLFLPPFLGGTVAGDYAITRTLPGAYSELVADRGTLALELGIRLDKPEGTGAQWSPRVGVSWRPFDGRTRLHASAGRAFKLPSFFALASPRALGGNPNLKPETSYGGDLGIDWRLASRVEAGVTAFRQRYENLIDFDFQRFLHVNRSAVEAQGIEATLAWRPEDRLSLEANGTWQQIEDLTTHVHLRHRPKRIGGARLRWRPIERLDLELGAQAVARSFDEQIPVPERDTVAGYGLIGLHAVWRLTSEWRFQARLDNLTDRRYETLIGFPGPGRSLRLGLSWAQNR